MRDSVGHHPMGPVRRFITIPVYFAVFTALLAIFPVLLVLCAVADLVRGVAFPAVRMLILSLIYFSCEVFGLSAVFFSMIVVYMFRLSRAQRDRMVYAIQSAWVRTTFWCGLRVLGMQIKIEGAECLSVEKPVVFFCRHVSYADTLIIPALVQGGLGVRLRYVVKKELTCDPIMDVIGHLLPNHFVDRASRHPEREIEAIRKLVDQLSPKDGILIFPEGTRFSASKKAQALAALERSKSTPSGFLETAIGLKHLLPPQLGGPRPCSKGGRRSRISLFVAMSVSRA